MLRPAIPHLAVGMDAKQDISFALVGSEDLFSQAPNICKYPNWTAETKLEVQRVANFLERPEMDAALGQQRGQVQILGSALSAPDFRSLRVRFCLLLLAVCVQQI